jgi:hypothetical protein
MVRVRKVIFLSILKVVIADLNALVAVLIQLPTGGDSLHDPYLARLESVLGQQEANQLWLRSWKEKKVYQMISSK